MKNFIFVLLIIILVGCQNRQLSIELRNDANSTYLSIKNKIENQSFLTSDEYREMQDFKTQYINNYEDYPSDEKLLSEMERLINSYTFYLVATGLKDTDGIDMYKQRLEKSLNDLDKQFNN